MKILITPLHWGLGHASRCVPLVNRFLKEGHEVILASDGAALRLLQKEFSSLETIELPAYNILYPTKNMLWNLMVQSKKFFKAVKSEYTDIQLIVQKYSIEMIVSDNRFGCYSPLAKRNIFITHQVNLLTPFGLFDAPARWINHHLMKRFDEIWIPDEAEETQSLAGKLSHGHLENLPKVTYMGAQSRMQNILPDNGFYFFEKNKDAKKIAVVLSGPEPQRTFLEEKIIEQAKKSAHDFIIVRGLANENQVYFLEKNIKIYSHQTSNDLNKLMLEADFIISRSGYSTIMDLVVLQKNALLIPTPGQSEQEYLAKRFQENGLFLMQKQENLDLSILPI
jgi:spore coat polysaccharide biosynthesis predicted glycosyltransferase SpsG